MERDAALDVLLAGVLDDLLSIASLAAATGRPELARAASEALDPLLPFADAPGAAFGTEPFPDAFPGARPHAEH